MRLRASVLLCTSLSLLSLASCGDEPPGGGDPEGGAGGAGATKTGSGGDSSGGTGGSSGGASSGGASVGGALGGLGGLGGGDTVPADAGVSVTVSGDRTTEWGGTVTVDVVLDSAPTAPVSLTLLSSDATEGALDVEEITFTSENWDQPREVTVTGQSDAENDTSVEYQVSFVVESDDNAYSSLDVAPITLTNLSFVSCSSFSGTDFDDEAASDWAEDSNFIMTFPAGADGSAHALQLAGGQEQHFVGARRDFDAMTPVYLSIWVKTSTPAEGPDYGSTFVILGDAEVESNMGIVWFYADEYTWRFQDGTNAHFLPPPVLGRWEHLELFIDWDTKTSDVYFNGAPAVDDMPFRSTDSENIQRMYLYNYYDSTGAWDEIEFGCVE